MINKLKNYVLNLSFIKTSLFLFIARLPYLIIFFPGLISSISSVSIGQFYGLQTDAARLSAVSGLTMSNHHPIIYAWIWGFFVKVGDFIGNQNIGVFLCVFLQVIFLNLIISYVLVTFKNHINNTSYLIIFLFYCLFPLISIQQITLSKDIVFSTVMLLFCTMLYKIYISILKNNFSTKLLIYFTISCLLLCFTKSQGVYILLIVAIVLLIIFKKNSLKLLLIIIFSSVFYLHIFCGIILPKCNIAPIGKQESIGFMLQQTARYVISNSDEVTPDEKEVIDKIIPYNTIKKKYNPSLQDPIKFTYKQDCKKEDLLNYYKTWFLMFLKHPETYIKATYLNCKDFFLGVKESDWFPQLLNEVPRFKTNECFKMNHIFKYHSEVASFLKKISDFPIINILYNTYLYVWTTIVFIILYVIKKDIQGLLFMLPLLITILILIVSPVACVRYILMLILTMPIFVALYFNNVDN